MFYSEIVSFIINLVETLGYFGIFFIMFLESSFFPIPSEIAMIPAGYLAFQGKFSLFGIVIVGILGSICGAWLNYFIAKRLGRKAVLRFLKKSHLDWIENFFDRHGHISTFNGRLLPVVRQYISFPAGLAKMNKWKFTFYTGLGSAIWVFILALLGYFLGANQDMVDLYLREIIIFVLVFVVLISFWYWWKNK